MTQAPSTSSQPFYHVFSRRSRAVADMTGEEISRIAASRMSPEHDHLNALLDEEDGGQGRQDEDPEDDEEPDI